MGGIYVTPCMYKMLVLSLQSCLIYRVILYAWFFVNNNSFLLLKDSEYTDLSFTDIPFILIL